MRLGESPAWPLLWVICPAIVPSQTSAVVSIWLLTCWGCCSCSVASLYIRMTIDCGFHFNSIFEYFDIRIFGNISRYLNIRDIVINRIAIGSDPTYELWGKIPIQDVVGLYCYLHVKNLYCLFIVTFLCCMSLGFELKKWKTYLETFTYLFEYSIFEYSIFGYSILEYSIFEYVDSNLNIRIFEYSIFEYQQFFYWSYVYF